MNLQMEHKIVSQRRRIKRRDNHASEREKEIEVRRRRNSNESHSFRWFYFLGMMREEEKKVERRNERKQILQ